MTQKMTPEQVREKFGPMFCKGLVTMVDERNISYVKPAGYTNIRICCF